MNLRESGAVTLEKLGGEWGREKWHNYVLISKNKTKIFKK